MHLIPPPKLHGRGGAANKNIGDAFLLVWKLPRGMRARELGSLAAAAAARGGAGGWGCGDGCEGSPRSSGSPTFPSHAGGALAVSPLVSGAKWGGAGGSRGRAG